MADDVLEVTVPSSEGDGEMPQGDNVRFDGVMEQNMAALAGVGVAVQIDMKTISKAQDYSYLQGKDMVSLTEAMGAREVASEKNPGGPSKPV